MKRRFLIGLLAVVIVSSPAFAQDADKSGKSEAPIVVRVVPMKHAFSGQIASVVGTVSRGVRFAWDEASNSLVLSGPEDDIAAALEVVQQLDVPRRDLATAVEGPLSLRLTVFYVEGTYDAGGAGSDSKLPEALGRVSKVLTENGMHHLRLMTSQIINIKSDEKYIAIGTLDDPSGYMRVLTRGRMKFARPVDSRRWSANRRSRESGARARRTCSHFRPRS